MPHSKKPKLTHDDEDVAIVTAASISSDELAIIFGYLGPVEILPLRRVCKKWNEAARKTIVPIAHVDYAAFKVDDGKTHHTMKTMSTALPNLQQLKLGELRYDYWNKIHHRYADGEDPQNVAGSEMHRSANSVVTHEIDMISNFTKLKVLELEWTLSSLNGSYPTLFNFPLLENLTVCRCDYLKWDLGMLAGLPLLRVLNCKANRRLTGNIHSLRVLKDTLEEVVITHCTRVEGNFMDLADFPHLKILDIDYSMVSIMGDVRDMKEGDFPKLRKLCLPKSVYGGDRSEIMRISDAKDLIAAIYSIKNQRNRHPSLFQNFEWYLSQSSPDWYKPEFGPPFSFRIVRAGSRLGWRWEQSPDYAPDYVFEMNWLDPLPAKGNSDYQRYFKSVGKIESYRDRFPFFKGYHEPPSESVYLRLAQDYRPSQEEMDMCEM